jgi:hypothetical protein
MSESHVYFSNASQEDAEPDQDQVQINKEIH